MSQTCETCHHWGPGVMLLGSTGFDLCRSSESPDAWLHWGRNHTCAKWEPREDEEEEDE